MTEASDIQSPIFNRRIAFVGKLGGMNRREARDLIRSHGAVMVERIDETVDLIVVGADELTLDETDTLLDQWTLEAAANGHLTIINETQFWQDLGMVDADLDVAQLYTPAMLADLLDLPISTIRRWHRRGLITPARQIHKLAYFDFQEVASARRIARHIASGASPEAIERKLSQLAELYPDVQRPLSQLSVIVQGKSVLLRDGEGLIEPGGQKLLNFDLAGDGEELEPAAVISMQRAVEEAAFDQLSSPEEFFAVANAMEDSGDLDAAIEVYRASLLAFGPSADVSFRLAELLYQCQELTAARERYYMAIELDEAFVEARASLGCVLVELGEPELARSAFAGALQHHPDYPDVHFHLARLLDDMECSSEADEHWARFLELAPKSPWAAEARERLANRS